MCSCGVWERAVKAVDVGCVEVSLVLDLRAKIRRLFGQIQM
jgi:hypothetical protein